MSETTNVLPVLVDLATKLAGEDQTNDWLRTIRGGPSTARVYTPADLGLQGVSLGSVAAGNWVDVSGFRTLTAFVRVAGTYGGTPYSIDFLGSPVGAGDTWGSDVQWAAALAMRTGLAAVGNVVLGNTGNANSASSTAWTGCIARRARIDIGAAGAQAQAWAYLVCLPCRRRGSYRRVCFLGDSLTAGYDASAAAASFAAIAADAFREMGAEATANLNRSGGKVEDGVRQALADLRFSRTW